MLLPLGILASAGGAASDYELISTTLVTSAVPSVTFNSSAAWASYKHLQLRVTARDNRNGFQGSNHYLRLNGDSANNYSQHSLYGTGSSAGAGGSNSQTAIYLGDIPALGGTTNAFAADVIDILDFSQTSKNTTVRSLSGMAQNYNWLTLSSGAWLSTNSVTSITLLSTLGNFVSGSRFSLYGLKG